MRRYFGWVALLIFAACGGTEAADEGDTRVDVVMPTDAPQAAEVLALELPEPEVVSDAAPLPDVSVLPDVSAPPDNGDVLDAADTADVLPPQDTLVDVSDIPPDSPADTEPDAEQDAATEPGCELLPPPVPISVTGTARLKSLGALEYPGLLPRTVRVLLPTGYDAQPDQRYPVLYMHDGQNLFEDGEAAFGVAWEVDDALDALAAAGTVEARIVVAIDNTAERLADYSVGPAGGYSGKGDLYADFVALHLKAIVDALFRTRCGRSDTAIAGSSMGGVISLHTFMRHPDLFGGVGAVSTAAWYEDGALLNTFGTYEGRLPERLWFDTGTLEGASPQDTSAPYYVADTRVLRDLATAKGMVLGRDLGMWEIPARAHNEAAWEARLPTIFGFLFGAAAFEDLPTEALQLYVYKGYARPGAPTTVALSVRRGAVGWLTYPASQAALESLQPGVAEIGSDGSITALSAGVATLTAAAFGLTASAPVVVPSATETPVTFLAQTPTVAPSESVWISGDALALGAWNGAALQLQRLADTLHEGTLALPTGTAFEYKYTRGTWETVEKLASGAEAPNRGGVADAAKTLADAVQRWADGP